ncbi:MAG: PAS domain S-box protein [Bacteroidales bacterium]|nr:PAS domain S-box protein [Bacteroidales bacterium]
MKKDLNKTKEQLSFELNELRNISKEREGILEIANQQLVATNQQLSANEQQLRAANQQLIAGEHELKKEKNFSERIVETASAIIVGLDKDHKIRIFNKGAESITGYTKAEVVGKDWFKIFFPKEMLNEMNKVWKDSWGITSHSYVNPILSKTGKEIIVSWQTTGMYESEDVSKHLSLSIGEDITGRKQEEEKLKENEIRLNHIQNSSAAVLYKAIPSGDFPATFISENVVDLVGFEARQFTTDTQFWINNIHPEDLEKTINSFGDLFKNDYLNSEYRFKCKNGKYIWINDVTKLIRDINNKPIETVGFWSDITERKQAEETLIVSENKYRSLAETSTDVILTLDMEGRFTYLSPVVEKITGYPFKHFLGRSLTEMIAPEYIESTIERFKRGLSGEETPLYEIEVLLKDGGRLPVELNTSNLLDREGKVIGRLAVVRDITERKIAEQELKKSENKHRTLIETTSEGFWLIDLDKKTIDVNQSLCDMLGYFKDEMIGKTPMEFVDEENSKLFKEQTSKITETTHRTYETLLKKKNGEKIPTIFSATTLFDKNGNHNGSFAFVTNITKRKQAEEALTHSHNLMSYIIEHSRSAVAVHDREMKYIYVSQHYLDEYNVKEKDVIGKHHYDVFPYLPQKWRDVHQKALAGEISSAEDDPYEREDGTVDWTRCECRPWYEADGSIGGLIVYTEVITERKEAEEELKKKMNELEIFNDATVGREFKMIELKKEINELLAKTGQKPKYEIPA